MVKFFSAAVLLALPISLSYAAGDVEAGKGVFKRCASCHLVGPSARGAFGPHLNGLFGRKAGSTPDYKYSSAMKKSGIIWTEQSLTTFLRDPSDVVPGNKMRFWGLNDDKQIADLLAYLRTYQAY